MHRLAAAARNPRLTAVVAVVALVVVVLGVLLITRARAVYVLQPIYEIEVVSGPTELTVGGNEMGQPGTPQVPTPVRIDDDLVPDVLVSVNLVEVSGVLSDEPFLGDLDEALLTADEATAPELLEPILVPNVQVVRNPAAVALGKVSPPVRLQVKLTARDVSLNPQPDVVVRFGYDTGGDGASPCPEGGTAEQCAGRIGSIPQHFQALLRGLDSPEPFNPLIAEVTTLEGPLFNPLAPRRHTYEGPLDLVASISEQRPLTQSLSSDLLSDARSALGTGLRFAYKPFPGTVRIRFADGRDVEPGDDGQFAAKPGQHVLYEHARRGEVDLDTNVVLFGEPQDEPQGEVVVPRTVVDARVDRLPRRIRLDMETADTAGSVDYRARSDGRRPDVTVNVDSQVLLLEVDEAPQAAVEAEVAEDVSQQLKYAGLYASFTATVAASAGSDTTTVVGEPVDGTPAIFAQLDLEALPSHIHADWSTPTGGTAQASFCAGPVDSGGTCTPAASGIGAVEARVRNFRSDEEGALPGFLPEAQQFASFETAELEDGSVLMSIAARVEQVRAFAFEQTGDGFSATSRVGDGEAPLQLHVFRDDTRVPVDPDAPSGGSGSVSAGPCDPATGGGTGGDGNGGAGTGDGEQVTTGRSRMAFTSTVVPLPDDITISLAQPCPLETDDPQEPLTLVYDASKSVDVNAHIDVREQIVGAAALPVCGQIGTICGDLRVRHIPDFISVKVRQFPAPIPDLAPPDQRLFPETRVDVDAVPFGGGSKPDFFFDALVGQEDESPAVFDDDIPLSLHAEVRGFPRHIRIRAREGIDETLDRVEFHACDFQYELVPPACTPATQDDRIDAVSFQVRNWVGERPPGLPVLVPDTPLYATLAGVGAKHGVVTDGGVVQTDIVRFEAAAQITDISEAQYRNTGKIFGLRSRIGANKDMSAKVDLRRIVFQDTTDPISVSGAARVTPVPGEWDFCLRQPHQPVGALDDEFTDQCEQPPESFGPDSQPLSIGFDANTTFDVEARGALLAHGPDPSGTDDDFRINGYVHIQDLPSVLEAHLDAPPSGTEGPIRFESTADSSVSIDFEAEVADADLVCEDPRTVPLDTQVMCARGRIENLPQKTFFEFDPAKEEDNLLLDTDGGGINIVGFRGDGDAVLSRVASKRKGAEGSPDFDVLVPDVVIAEATLRSLPDVVEGTINMPGTLELTATPDVGEIDATVRNFVMPDPMPLEEPTRQVRPDLRVGPDDPGLKAVVFGRKDTDTGQLLFKGIVHVEDFRGFAYKTAKDADGNLLDTRVISADFGTDQVIRAYADVDDGTTHVVGDVVLPVPRGIDVCFRGEREASGEPVEKTFCDIVPEDDEGAFQFVQRGNEEMDVHAYVRHATGGGADVLSARADILNIPKVVQGTFTSGGADVAGFSTLDSDGIGVQPDGIDEIAFHLATFDIDDHGYLDEDDGFPGSHVPFDERIIAVDPFPAVKTARQHVGLAALPERGHFEARGRIGPQSQLQRVRVSDKPCAKPEAKFGSRPDYPVFPDDDVWSYTCIRGDFVSEQEDPLDLNAVIGLEDGRRISLREAGLTDIPEFFQVNIADGPATDAAGMRPPCQTAPSAPNCAPPLARIDTPGTTAVFGVAEFGKPVDLARLFDQAPRVDLGPVPDFNAAPGEQGCGWSEWGNCADANLEKRPAGVRAKVALMEDGGAAVRAGFRFLIPASITIDPLQTWSKTEFQPQYIEASDFRFRAASRRSDGTIINKLGEVAGFLHAFSDGAQVVLSDADEPVRGIAVPGDVGLAMYDRNAKHNGRHFIQIDGRVSADMDLGARVLTGDGGFIHARVLNVPKTEPGYPEVAAGPPATWKPTFRLRAEIKGDGETPPTDAEGSTEDGGGEPEEEESCTPLLCAVVQIRLKRIDAFFDFNPSGTPARLLEAAIFTGGAKNGAEVIGWDSVEGGGTKTPFEAAVDVLVDPINVFFHAGIPVIGSLDFILMSDLRAGFALHASRFALRQNLLHVKTTIENSDTLQLTDIRGLLEAPVDPCLAFRSCLYIDYRIHHLHGLAFSILGLLWGNPIILGVDFLPPSVPRELAAPLDPTAVKVAFIDCLGPVPSPIPLPASPVPLPEVNLLPFNTGTDVVVWPIADPRLFFYGTLGPLFNGVRLVSTLIAPFMCAAPVDGGEIPLIRGTSPGAADRVPGDPIGPPETLPVLDVVSGPAAAPPAPLDFSTPPPLKVKAGDTLELCGDLPFSSIDIEAGGTLKVATSQNLTKLQVEVGGGTVPYLARCVAGDGNANLGRLSLASTGAVTVDGTNDIRIAGTVEGSFRPLSIVGRNVRVTGSGLVQGGRGKVTLAGAENVRIAGTVHADEVFPFAPPGGTSASGNSGGGHGGKGGNGSDGSGGGTFGDTGFAPVDSAGDPTDDGLVPTEGGSPGGPLSAALRGRGGGALTLVAGDQLVVGGTGRVSANGGDGGDAADDSCDTGSPGGGGGAGGGIMLSAPQVSIGGALEARGGDGGAGRGGGGGAGGGRVKIKTPLLSGTPDVGKGVGGATGCEEKKKKGDDGAGGQFLHDDRPMSSALPFAQLWQRGSDIAFSDGTRTDRTLDVGFTAADADDGEGVYVVLCGTYVPPDRPERDFFNNADPSDATPDDTPDGLNPVLQQQMPPAASASFFSPCGTFGSPFSPGAGFSFFPSGPLNPFFPFNDPRDPVVLNVKQLPNTPARTSGTIGAKDLPKPVASPGHERLNGFWGVWTTVIKGELDACAFGVSTCFFEEVPRTPDAIFGYDNSPPGFVVDTPDLSITSESGALVSPSRNVTLTIENINDFMQRKFPVDGDDQTIPLSGLKEARCANDPATESDFIPCSEDWKLPVDDGETTVHVRVFDQADNALKSVKKRILLDTTPPTSQGKIRSPLPAGVSQLNNGWYSASPHFELFGFSDPKAPDGSDGSGFEKYVYRFGEGREHDCQGVGPAPNYVCVIGDDAVEQQTLPGPGRHTLSWYAVDRAGNRQEVQSLKVRIDGTPPLTAFSTVATAPNGANTWFVTRTHGAVGAFDRPPGGSGFTIPADELGDADGSTFGIFYGIAPFPAVPAPTIPYTEPFEIPAGVHRVCWKAIDVAGNTGVVAAPDGTELTGDAGVHCSEAISVDLAPPAVTLNPAPAAPNGNNGWYVGAEPAVTIAVNDTSPGSGVGSDDDPALCRDAPLKLYPPGAPRRSGLCVSLDHGPFQPHDATQAITIPEGVRSVRAYAIDESGQESEVRELVLQVDLSPPVTTPRFLPPFPAQPFAEDGWWRRDLRALLRATDGEANAGLLEILFGEDDPVPSNPLPPRLPFVTVNRDDKEFVLSFQARDLAGQPVEKVSPGQRILKVDRTPVIAKATKPTHDKMLSDSGDLPVVWAPEIHGPAQLNWKAWNSAPAPAVKARVIVYNVLGMIETVLEDTIDPDETNADGTLAGFASWDGTSDQVRSPEPELEADGEDDSRSLVPAGLYWYRVVLVDEAGNVAQSGESHPLLVKIGETVP